jgi:hypothetical protein
MTQQLSQVLISVRGRVTSLLCPARWHAISRGVVQSFKAAVTAVRIRSDDIVNYFTANNDVEFSDKSNVLVSCAPYTLATEGASGKGDNGSPGCVWAFRSLKESVLWGSKFPVEPLQPYASMVVTSDDLNAALAASAAVAVSLASLLTGKQVSSQTSITGEISLS